MLQSKPQRLIHLRSLRLILFSTNSLLRRQSSFGEVILCIRLKIWRARFIANSTSLTSMQPTIVLCFVMLSRIGSIKASSSFLRRHICWLTLIIFPSATVNLVNAYIPKQNKAPRLEIDLAQQDPSMHHLVPALHVEHNSVSQGSSGSDTPIILCNWCCEV